MTRAMQIVVAAGLLAAWQGGKPGWPKVPKDLEAPPGDELILSAHAKGVQIYVCQAGVDKKFAWLLKAPEAELTDTSGNKIIHHFVGPTWAHVDGSQVAGKVVAKADAPKPDAIPWLLLAATSHAGEGILSRVTIILRIHTEGGLAPSASSCEASANGKEVRSAYEADYYFFAPTPN